MRVLPIGPMREDQQLLVQLPSGCSSCKLQISDPLSYTLLLHRNAWSGLPNLLCPLFFLFKRGWKYLLSYEVSVFKKNWLIVCKHCVDQRMYGTAKWVTHSQLLMFGVEGRDSRKTIAWEVGDLSANPGDILSFLCDIAWITHPLFPHL